MEAKKRSTVRFFCKLAFTFRSTLHHQRSPNCPFIHEFLGNPSRSRSKSSLEPALLISKRDSSVMESLPTESADSVIISSAIVVSSVASALQEPQDAMEADSGAALFPAKRQKVAKSNDRTGVLSNDNLEKLSFDSPSLEQLQKKSSEVQDLWSNFYDCATKIRSHFDGIFAQLCQPLNAMQRWSED